MLNNPKATDFTHKDLTTALIRNPITVSPEVTVREAIALMSGAQSPCETNSTAQESNQAQTAARASCVIVVESYRIVGIFTERDVVHLCAEQPSLDELSVSQVMTTSVLTLRESAFTDLFSAINLLQQNYIRHLPIVDEQDYLVGLVTHETLQQVLQPVADVHQRLQLEQVIANVATAIRTSLHLQTILDTAVEQIRQAIRCDRVNIWRFDPDLSTVVVAESTASPRSLLGERVWDECYQQHISEVYREGYVRVVPDIYTTEMTDCHRELLISLQTRAKVLLPLFCGEQLWGLLNVSESQAARDWQADEIDLLRKLATQLTIAIQQASTHEQLQAELQERQQAETILQIKNDLLDRVATQATLADTLNYVSTRIEGMLDGAICSILLLDHNNQLHEGASPSLPAHYRRQIDGIQVGEGVGSCGTAVHRREKVIVTDIANDPLWQDFRDLALTSGLRACWSTPIVALNQSILGTFAIYYREVRSPQADEMTLVESVVPIVMLAIQRHQNEIALKRANLRMEEAQRIAHLGHWELNLQHNALYWGQEVFRLFELDPQQCCPTYEIFWEFVHPDDRDAFNEAFSKHLRDRQPFSIVHRLLMPDGRIKYVQGQCETTFSADGTPLISHGTVQDITQQQEAEIRRERVEASLRQVIEGTAAFTGEEFFPALVRHIGEALGVRCVAVGKATSEGFQVLAFFADGELCLPQFLPYDLVPCCHQTLQDGNCCHSTGLQALYPGNTLFTNLQAESYLGVSLHNTAGEPKGSLCIFHDAPLADPDWAQTLVSTFAGRAGAELERLLTSQALEQLNAELEERVTQRTTMLAEREARYRGLMEGAADAILLFNLQGCILEANQQAEVLLGYALAELTTLHFTQLHPPEELNKVTKAFAEIAQSQRNQFLDITFLRQDGTTVPVDLTATVIDIDGEKLVQGIFRDVSDRKQIETALRESQQFLQTVLDTVPLAVFWKDRSSTYLGANQRFFRDAALSSASELVGKNDFDMFWSATEGAAYRADDRVVIDTGEAKLGIIETLHRQDGSEIWLETNKLPLRNLVGEVVGVLGTYQDITDRRNAEIILKRQLAAIEAAIDGIAILQDERYVYLNSSYVELFGYQSTKELIGQSWRVLYSPEELERFDQEIWPALYERMSWQGEVKARRKDGTTFPEQLSLTLSADNLLICVCQDISVRRREQAELQQKTAELDRFFSLALDLLSIANLDGYFVRLNHQWEKVLGYSLSDLEGAQFIDFVHPEDVEATLQAMKTLEQGGDIIGFTNRYRCWDGSYRWIEWRSAPSGNLIYSAARDITNRKQAEIELQNSTDRLTLALQAGTYGIWDWDLVNDALWDEQMYTIYGLQDRDRAVSYQEWRDRVHSDDINWLESHFEAALQNKTSFQAEFRIWRNGELRWIQTIARPQYDAKGNPVRVVAINCDITNRKAAELHIRQQADREALLREITQRIRQSLDLQTIFETACQEIRLVLQADRVCIFKFYPDSNWNDGEFVAESVVEGLVSTMAIRIHDHCFGEKYAPLYRQGRYAAIEDIYQLEHQCHTDVLVQFQVRANLIMPLLAGDNLWGLLCIHQCSRTRQWQPFEIDLTQQLASQLAIAIQQANLYEQLQQELAERQQAQSQLTERNQQLAVTNQELARATRLKDEFLANMSHELRTPLNAILGMTEGLQDEVFGSINEKQINALKTIESSGFHLLALINDILDVAKIESGQINLECTQFFVDQLCSSSMTFIKQQAFKKRIHLQTNIPPYLPNLFADERRIRQALLNLLTNAIKFTPEGGTITLTVSLLPPKADTTQQPHLRMAVTDTGIGIAPENMSKLFQPFVQIDSALNRQYTGTGLGLALVKQIVELHGGQVSLTSKLGLGSCFTIDLPYDPNMFSAMNPTSLSIANESSLSAANPGDLTSTQAPLILMAEDNPANIETISNYLEAKGYRLLLANNGQEAVDLAASHHPDVILMDIQMPGMDGLTAMQQIRQQESLRKIPIIALTALAMMGDQERCLAAGADNYLSKPVKLKQLDISIKELLADRKHEWFGID